VRIYGTVVFINTRCSCVDGD